MRKVFIETLTELARKDERIFLMSPDLGFSVLEKFEHEHPDKFLNTGISEANTISMAAGMALEGRIVYVYSIIPFVTMRPFEQVRVDGAYMNTRIRLIGVGAGLSYGPAGATHHAIEDISIMRSLPNMTVFSPGSLAEVREGTLASVETPGPVYFRFGRETGLESVPETTGFQFGKILSVESKGDILILSTGNTRGLALQTAEILRTCGFQVALAQVHTIKPLDTDYLAERLGSLRGIFTIEEHSIIGGLGSAIAEFLAEQNTPVVFKRFGIPDTYSHTVGDQDFLREHFGLCPKTISSTIKEML